VIRMIIAVRSPRSLASESKGDSMARGYAMIEQCVIFYGHHIHTKKHRLAQYDRDSQLDYPTYDVAPRPRSCCGHEEGGRREEEAERRRRRRRGFGVAIIEKEGWKSKPCGRRSWLSRSGWPPPRRARTHGSGSPWPPPPPPRARSTPPCCSGASWNWKQRLKANNDSLVSSVETRRAVNSGFDTVNLHRPTVLVDIPLRLPSPARSAASRK